MLQESANKVYSIINVMVSIITFVLGVVAGVSAFFIHGWFEKIKERRVILKALILEISYTHQNKLYLELLRHSSHWPNGPYDVPIDRSKYTTIIYDTYLPKVISLLDYKTALQIHYYYSLVKGLNRTKDKKDNEIDLNVMNSYLETSAHAYSMSFGAIDVLFGKKMARKVIETTVKNLESGVYHGMLEKDNTW